MEYFDNQSYRNLFKVSNRFRVPLNFIEIRELTPLINLHIFKKKKICKM